MPAGAHGYIWRVVLDSRIPDGLAQIRAGWCLDDLVAAHTFLDEFDARDRARASASKGGS